MLKPYKNNIFRVVMALLFFAAFTPNCTQKMPYLDLSHYSKVFGTNRSYRLYLPKGYDQGTTRYPVIYYFHGWGGRPWKDDNARLDYGRLQELVDKYQVLLVMWDGCMDGVEPNPYNVGNHEDVKFQVQMKDYFLELIAHTDSAYRTLPDREHRGIIGFSMGGFMSLYLAGKYPDRIGAAVSLAGSAEFWVGYPDNQTWYPMRYTFSNLRDVAVRIHNGNSDILTWLNEEVYAGSQWEGKELDYYTFNGGHMIDHHGQTLVFEKAVKFLTDTFHKPQPRPANWSHYDLYADFDIWGYQIVSNKNQPGFIFLKNVDRDGFGVSTYKWLLAGPPLDTIKIRIITAPLYTPGKSYKLIDTHDGHTSESSVNADAQGRLTIDTDGAGHQFGIEGPASPDWVFLDHSGHYLYTGKENKLTIRMFDRGGAITRPQTLRFSISTTDSAVRIDTTLEVLLRPGQRIVDLPPITVFCSKKPPPHAEPSEIRFRVDNDDFIVPVWFDVPNFDSVRIDDGLAIRDSAWGRGNANGSADAGESLMIYQGVHPLRLYSDDPWLQKDKERIIDRMIPARWPDGFDMSSVICISPDCPDGHSIEFLACYDTKTFNPIERKLTWGKIKITVHHPN
jgi:enterochelin esterase-like enzyme